MKTFAISAVLAAAALLAYPSGGGAYGVGHVGYTHVGPAGVYHTGRTVAYGPGGVYAGGHTTAAGYGGAYRSGYGYGAGYGGYRYTPSYSGGAYGYRYGYVR